MATPQDDLLFISYAHADERIVDALMKDLESVRYDSEFDIFRDNRSIESGHNWSASIETALHSCTIALLVVSVDFWTSEFIREKELPVLEQRSATGEIQVLPVLASSVSRRSGPAWVRDLQFFDEMRVLPAVDAADFRTKSTLLADEVADRFARTAEAAAAPAPSVPAAAPVPPPAQPPLDPHARAIQHFAGDAEVQGWLARRGATTWMNVKASLMTSLEEQGVADPANVAYQLVPTAMNRCFGEGQWRTEKRPRKNDPTKTTSWVVLGAKQSAPAPPPPEPAGRKSRWFGRGD